MQLSSQGLLHTPINDPSKEDILKTIRQMGILQIDTINVVNRSPYLVLWSRLGNYDPSMLERVHKDGDLFEYLAHAACFIPTEDYPLFRRKMLDKAEHWWNKNEWVGKNIKVLDFVLDKIKENGPQKSSDFPNRPGGTNGWWDWKEEKIALDMLWTKGDLMIPYRKKFQRYYDLAENVIGIHADHDIPEMTAMVETLVEKTIEILGATRQKWIADYYRLKQKDVQISIEKLLSLRKITKIDSEIFSEGILIHNNQMELYEKTQSGVICPERTTILSPFDPLIWDRIRTKELFDFDYTLECYVPASKRKFGYFSLPILHLDRLVGRFDAKAHRKEKVFEIKQFHFEPWFEPDPLFYNNFSECLREFSDWHHANRILLPLDKNKHLESIKDLLDP
jgi:uncharacterized protein YcaQ